MFYRISDCKVFVKDNINKIWTNNLVVKNSTQNIHFFKPLTLFSNEVIWIFNRTVPTILKSVMTVDAKGGFMSKEENVLWKHLFAIKASPTHKEKYNRVFFQVISICLNLERMCPFKILWKWRVINSLISRTCSNWGNCENILETVEFFHFHPNTESLSRSSKTFLASSQSESVTNFPKANFLLTVSNLLCTWGSILRIKKSCLIQNHNTKHFSLKQDNNN